MGQPLEIGVKWSGHEEKVYELERHDDVKTRKGGGKENCVE